MSLLIRLKIFRWCTFLGIPILIFIFTCYIDKISISISDLILSITALLIAWYSSETLALVELTRVKDRPFLEITFQENGAKVILKNLGTTPAYSPSINLLQVDENMFEFDPLFQSRLPILSGEAREVWMHHKNQQTGSSFVYSLPALHNAILNSKQNSPLKITIQYFDKDGAKLKRNLYIKIGGELLQKKYIYTSTSPKS